MQLVRYLMRESFNYCKLMKIKRSKADEILNNTIFKDLESSKIYFKLRKRPLVPCGWLIFWDSGELLHWKKLRVRFSSALDFLKPVEKSSNLAFSSSRHLSSIWQIQRVLDGKFQRQSWRARRRTSKSYRLFLGTGKIITKITQ